MSLFLVHRSREQPVTDRVAAGGSQQYGYRCHTILFWAARFGKAVAKLNNEASQKALYESAYGNRRMPRIRIACRNGGAQHMALVKQAARAVVTANITANLSEGGRERRQATVVVAPMGVSAAVEATAVTSNGMGPEVPDMFIKQRARPVLKAIRHKFKF